MDSYLVAGVQMVGILTQFDHAVVEAAEDRGAVAPRTHIALHVVPEGIGIGGISLGVGAVGQGADPGDLVERSDAQVRHGLGQILTGHFY